MTIEKINFSLVELLADFVSVNTFKANEKGIDFKFELDTPIPDVITSDPVRLRQVLSNLVGNAIKFTSRGAVELRVGLAESGKLKFIISDTGVGITPEQEQLLFQPFSQADASTTRKFGGTGLGLVLSRGLAESLNGSLSLIRSDRGHSSTFAFEIQASRPAQSVLVGRETIFLHNSSVASASRRTALKGLRVLLAEDSADNQTLISTYLMSEGAKVAVAENGQRAIDLVSNEKFDVILMDIQMPILDGHEATRQLRRLKCTHPIVALTAHAMKEEQQKCFESGFNDFLTKPIQRTRLMEILKRYLPGRE
jgi:CheY-like chemotaxis protein